MQVLQAGSHKLLLLELDPELATGLARQAGLTCRAQDGERALTLELTALGQAPLLLFDAADPGNLGWFSRCQFYVDGRTGRVLQTPLSVANRRDRNGRPLPAELRLQVAKELPAGFRLPGRQAPTEPGVYAVLQAFLAALAHTGVAVCGRGLVAPLAGRGDNPH